MTTVVTIQQLEAAINVARDRNPPSTENYALSADVKVLADLWGRMICYHEKEVAASELNSAQHALLFENPAQQATQA